MKKKTKRLTVEQKNKAFERLTHAQKRVTIAHDVIAQLKSEKLVAESGVYVTGINTGDRFNPNTQLKTIFNQTSQCNVCGIGALFVCMVKRINNIKVKDISTKTTNYDLENSIFQDTLTNYLDGYFTQDQLSHIEKAFECTITNHLSQDQMDNDSGRYFYDQSNSERLRLSAEERLTFIMLNIIKHNGTFKFQRKYRPINTFILPE